MDSTIPWPEIWGLIHQLTDISAVRENEPYLWMLFGFRVIVDLYVVGLVTLLVRALWGVAINSLRLVNPF